MAELGYPGDRARPARVRLQPDAAMGDLDSRLRESCSTPSVRRSVSATCTLVGNSMGGFIAAEVAVGEPEWVDRLVLVSSAGISHATHAARPGRRGSADQRRDQPAAAPPRLRLDEAARASRGSPSARSCGIPSRCRASSSSSSCHRPSARPGFVPAVAALTGYDLLDRLRRIRVPTLVVWGRDDLVVPAADAAGFVERIPGAAARRLRGLRPRSDGGAPDPVQPAARPLSAARRSPADAARSGSRIGERAPRGSAGGEPSRRIGERRSGRRGRACRSRGRSAGGSGS